MRRITVLLVSIILSAASVSGQTPAGNTQKCLECHAKVIAQERKHKPAEKKCEICHKPNGKTHPVEGVKGFTLVEKMPDLCYQCHDAMNDQKSVHTPVAGGKCLSCHNPHSSENEALLKYPKATICQECHETDAGSKKSVHKAVTDGNCQSCHNSHQSNFKKQLKSESASLCLGCHEKQKELGSANTVHPPFQKNCLICHTGHSSDTLHLLKERTPDLCFGCHDDIQAAVQEAKHGHAALNAPKDCMNCHSPHASAEKKLLVADETKTCVNCHSKSLAPVNKPSQGLKYLLQNSTYTHGGVSKLGCSGCHQPHGSANKFILAGKYREGVFTSINKESFLVCFNCHKSELLLKETTDDATGFRDGKKNLHFVHIQGSTSRSCASCHNVHGAKNRYLIAEKVPFGNWDMPIIYTIHDGGGTCTPGCHGERTYKR